MNITLNGESHTTNASTLAELIAEQQLEGKRYAVEVNGELVFKSQLATVMLEDNMSIEIVIAVGGG